MKRNKFQKTAFSVICVVLAVVMVLSLVITVLPANAVDETDLERLAEKRAQLEEQLAEQEQVIAELSDNQTLIVYRKAALDKQISLNRETISLIEEQIDLYQELIDRKEEELAAYQRFFRERKDGEVSAESGEPVFGIYEKDGTKVEGTALHPVGLLATIAEGSLVTLHAKDPAAAENGRYWLERFWNTPLRRGDRRYYDNFLYMFAFLALAGEYRIY